MRILKKLACRLLGHAGPTGVAYKESKPMPRESGNAFLSGVEWDCPRCGQQVRALKMRPEKIPSSPGSNRISPESS